MSRGIGFDIHGLPAAQGSKRHVGNGIMVESSKAVKPWRQDVVAAARHAMHTNKLEMFRTPVIIQIRFYFTRPKTHYRTGTHAGELKPLAPFYVGKRPDIDKLLRSTFDALTLAGFWADDALAVEVLASKCWRGTDGPGASLVVEAVDQ